MLTKRQKQVLDFITSFRERNGYSPALEEICKNFRLASVSTAYFHVQKLQEMGFLEKQNNKPRSITPFEDKMMVNIPLFGRIAAGQPIEALENKEMIAIPRDELPRVGNFFALRVVGESMRDEGIHDGDIILIKRQEIVENGQKIVALIDSYGVVLKKFYKEKGYIRLQSANKDFAPLIIKRSEELSIQGIVVDILRNEEDLQAKELKTATKRRVIRFPVNRIILGDAVEGLRSLPDNSCDVIIIDPPYNIGKNFGNNYDRKGLGDYVNWSKKWINESIRIMKPTGTMFIYGFSEILAYLSVEIPLSKRWLIWHYINKNVASLNFWQRSHEAIICAWKDKPIFNRDEIREPYTEGFLNGAAGKVRKGTMGRFSRKGIETIYQAHRDGALPRDVIKIPALAGGAGMVERWFLCKTCNDVYEPRKLKDHSGHTIIKHPTQKPLGLTRKLIKSAMPKKGGVVLVPFVGSGSECVVAKELGLSYIGYELNPDYIRIAKKWLATININPRLF